MFIYLLKYCSNIGCHYWPVLWVNFISKDAASIIRGTGYPPLRALIKRHLEKGADSSKSPPPLICTDWKKYTAPCSPIKMRTAMLKDLTVNQNCLNATHLVQRHIQQCYASANVDKMIILCIPHSAASP